MLKRTFCIYFNLFLIFFFIFGFKFSVLPAEDEKFSVSFCILKD
jgi:hypothetical protein